jgi:hypothetical protein
MLYSKPYQLAKILPRTKNKQFPHKEILEPTVPPVLPDPYTTRLSNDSGPGDIDIERGELLTSSVPTNALNDVMPLTLYVFGSFHSKIIMPESYR